MTVSRIGQLQALHTVWSSLNTACSLLLFDYGIEAEESYAFVTVYTRSPSEFV